MSNLNDEMMAALYEANRTDAQIAPTMRSSKRAERKQALAVLSNGGASLPNANGEVFRVGDGVHSGINGDSYPYTVRRVSANGKTVWVSGDDHEVTNKERAIVAQYGMHEGASDSVFTPRDVPESDWVAFRFCNNKRCRNQFANSYSTLHQGRVFSRNPSF